MIHLHFTGWNIPAKTHSTWHKLDSIVECHQYDTRRHYSFFSFLVIFIMSWFSCKCSTVNVIHQGHATTMTSILTNKKWEVIDIYM